MGRRVALVTGGAQGLGLAIGAQLVLDGFDVVLGDLDEEAVGRAAAKVGATGIRLDVTDDESVAAAFARLESGAASSSRPHMVW